MRSTLSSGRWAAVCAAMLLAWWPLRPCGVNVASAQPPADYIRVVEEDDGQKIGLETSARVFRPASGSGPAVVLVGVMHIGDHGYYEALQKYLDDQGLVLFEGVKPSGAGQAALSAPDDAARTRLTEQRLRLLATLVERQKVEKGAYPEDLEALVKSLRRPAARIARGAMVDGWGNPVAYTLGVATQPPDGGFDLVSLGSDGESGGEGAAADLKFSDQPALSKAEVGEKREGIQTQLASALGLEFQLLAIDYERPTWRNSDLSVDQVQAKLKESGTSGEALFRMLDGSSLPARLVGLVLSFIRADPSSQAMAKLVLVEVLGRADEMFERSGGGVGRMMKVIVNDRNDAVLDDLRKVLAEEPAHRSVALFYGAGHLPDLERRLTAEFGYQFAEDRWFRAIELDLNALGMTVEQARKIRQTMGQAIRRQLDGARRQTTEPGEKRE